MWTRNKSRWKRILILLAGHCLDNVQVSSPAQVLPQPGHPPSCHCKQFAQGPQRGELTARLGQSFKLLWRLVYALQHCLDIAELLQKPPIIMNYDGRVCCRRYSQECLVVVARPPASATNARQQRQEGKRGESEWSVIACPGYSTISLAASLKDKWLSHWL